MNRRPIMTKSAVAILSIVGAVAIGAAMTEWSAFAADAKPEHHAVILDADHMETGNFLTEGDLRKQLAGQDYQVFDIEWEDDVVEADVQKDGQTYELELDPKTGGILSVERED